MTSKLENNNLSTKGGSSSEPGSPVLAFPPLLLLRDTSGVSKILLDFLSKLTEGEGAATAPFDRGPWYLFNFVSYNSRNSLASVGELHC